MADRYHLYVVVFAWGVLATIGCRNPGTSPTAKAGGTVSYRGQPLAEVVVTFTPEQGRPAVGTTDAAGRFILSTYRRGDGAVPGRHQVTVNLWFREPPPMLGGPDKPTENPSLKSLPYPSKYSSPASSDLIAEVRLRGTNDFVLELKDP